MPSNEHKRHLFLVHSSTGHSNFEHDGVEDKYEVEGVPLESIQLELFGTEKPDVMIFTQPLNLDFSEIQQLIEEGHITRIIDLREVPYMTFGNETRERFLQVMSERRIDYYNLAKLGGLIGTQIQKAQDYIESANIFNREPVRIELKRMIQNGPTMVFSDTDPSQDKLVEKFQLDLNQAEIEFSPYYTREH